MSDSEVTVLRNSESGIYNNISNISRSPNLLELMMQKHTCKIRATLHDTVLTAAHQTTYIKIKTVFYAKVHVSHRQQCLRGKFYIVNISTSSIGVFSNCVEPTPQRRISKSALVDWDSRLQNHGGLLNVQHVLVGPQP